MITEVELNFLVGEPWNLSNIKCREITCNVLIVHGKKQQKDAPGKHF